MTSIGVVVNPLAGFGGRRGLKGSDGPDVASIAFAEGAPTWSRERMSLALGALGERPERILAGPGLMGADSASAAGVAVEVVGDIDAVTSAADTRSVVAEMVAIGVDVLLFAGGDGTARDVVDTGCSVVVLGVPAGVKIQSACFATSPRAAGIITSEFLRGTRETELAEVVDLNEDLIRSGVVAPRLYGSLRVPRHRRLLQESKVASPSSEAASHEEIGRAVSASMDPDFTYLIGPGTTTLAITHSLGLDGTLLGVDVVRQGQLLMADADSESLAAIVKSGPTAIVVTPIGGQGYLLGRGNQQISPNVIRHVGLDRVIVVATTAKLAALSGRPLLVDTGDSAIDAGLEGFRRVITGIGQQASYPVSTGLVSS